MITNAQMPQYPRNHVPWIQVEKWKYRLGISIWKSQPGISYIRELQRQLRNGIVGEQFFCYFCFVLVLNKN